jgi:very-short-patch-repair endonuclease
MTEAGVPKWVTSDFLAKQVALATRYAEMSASERFKETMEHSALEGGSLCGVRFESPLEAAFYAWWTAFDFQTRVFHDLDLWPQRWVTASGERYRLDFAVHCSGDLHERLSRFGLQWQPIAVELDGHAFHEKSREQVTRRNKRDRDLQAAGWKVFHISFDEMEQRHVEAAFEVYDYAKSQAMALRAAARKAELAAALSAEGR